VFPGSAPSLGAAGFGAASRRLHPVPGGFTGRGRRRERARRGPALRPHPSGHAPGVSSARARVSRRGSRSRTARGTCRVRRSRSGPPCQPGRIGTGPGHFRPTV